MPTFKHVSLSIHTPVDPPPSPDNNFSWANTPHSPLNEYGQHKLRHTPKITSYIPSTTNCPFAISITILDTYEPKNKGDDRESLAAYVYFDGRAKEETATLLRRGVETWISSRWVEVREGELAEREFVFREVGLENFLSGLDISKEKEAARKHSKMSRRHSLPVRMEDDDDEEDSEVEMKSESAGQIRVDLFRVRCEGPVRRGAWGGMFKDTNNVDGSEEINEVDVSHTAGFSEPKPLDRDTVSTQSVSHLDPEGVVYASFVFFYRGERQLKKMGLIKAPPTLAARADSASSSSSQSPTKSKDLASLLNATNGLIPKGPDYLNGKSKGFTNFREVENGIANKKTNGIGGIKGLLQDEEEEMLMGDELNRDPRDLERELIKSEEEVRMEEELVGRVGRIKLKRSHSNTSLSSGDKSKSGEPGTPPPEKNKIFEIPGEETARKLEDEDGTSTKKRRGSRDDDVKSPRMGIPGLLSNIETTKGFSTLGSDPLRRLSTGAEVGNLGFGGLLPGGAISTQTMDMEDEEIL
ncbi:hypothetical protein RUND412_008096 [Rhizina undulata]